MASVSSNFHLHLPSASVPSSTAFGFLAELLPARDLTAETLRAGNSPTTFVPRDGLDRDEPEPLFDHMARILHRAHNRHLVLLGRKGTGKKAAIRELARLAALRAYSSLQNKTFLWFDCTDVGPEDSRGCLESLLAVARERENAILCIEGFALLFPRTQGGTNIPLIRAAARRPDVRLIGLMQPREYADFIGGDLQMREVFTPLELPEPDDETALRIAELQARNLEKEFEIEIAAEAVRRSVLLSSSFLFHESHPGKAVRILRQACEDARFDRTHFGRDVAYIAADRIDRVLSELTGIPTATFGGASEEVDYFGALRSHVVGQDTAIDDVGSELQLIKAGLTEPGKPASVMLFAGMTGVGKTELARRVAELYSGTRRLNVYTMGNFSEPHSVSGIIGVPPGYVGHDEGGRLVNELNADPYAVFLLDEAEKAHPNVWKPFLNLFDEGWITDQRGVKAYADRAIFILTTNAGADGIAQMVRTGKSAEEIEERVKTTLSRVRQERSSQPVFPPQFLARIRRTVVFAPLDEQAMLAITRLILDQVKTQWRDRRNKDLVVDETLVQALAAEAHRRNDQSGGKEGGRIIRKLISDLIERRVQDESTRCKEAYQACQRISVTTTIAKNELTTREEESSEPTHRLIRSAIAVDWR